jgi:AraC family transcriptional regulator
LAKVAVELERALARRAVYGGAGCISSRLLAQGDGWTAEDVVCTSGPRDRTFEEQHSLVRVVIVAAGTFQYRCALGCELMTPGSVLLGNAGQFFECGHEHAAGDRCMSFGYAPDYFERLAWDAGGRQPQFGISRLPSIPALSPTVARICAGLIAGDAEWEELSIQLAAQAVQLSGGFPSPSAPPSAVARVTRAIRLIERHPDQTLTLGILAEEARLSRYHFLRTFERLTGVTPHQYVLRTRLREAAMRLVGSPAKILDVALESGFGDASNFNRSFRGEFGVSPRVWKRAQATAGSC